jgi:hypothetical protein
MILGSVKLFAVWCSIRWFQMFTCSGWPNFITFRNARFLMPFANFELTKGDALTCLPKAGPRVPRKLTILSLP